MARIGLYAWGGPGTLRLLQVKYHAPRIDADSFMRLYDPATLAAAHSILGVTDCWVTYSWGFADATEAEDRAFITDRLPHFCAEGITAHAYVQGLNLVTREFVDQDVFCRDAHGRRLPYSKGRSLTCPNNPAARAIILDRVRAACGADFGGVFIDNILFGLPPFYIRRDFASAWGCACEHCQHTFQAQFGYPLPVGTISTAGHVQDFLTFRSASTYALLAEASALTRAAGKQFGVNLYDPYCMTPEVFFGYNLAQITPLLDYFLIENLALSRDNGHLAPLVAEAAKPVFVVSYRDGIGHDSAYSQADVDLIWSEAAAVGFSPCLKATEYVTGGQWHTLDIARLHSPTVTTAERRTEPLCTTPLKTSTRFERWSVRQVNRVYTRLFTAVFEHPLLAALMTRFKLDTRFTRLCRRYHL